MRKWALAALQQVNAVVELAGVQPRVEGVAAHLDGTEPAGKEIERQAVGRRKTDRLGRDIADTAGLLATLVEPAQHIFSHGAKPLARTTE